MIAGMLLRGATDRLVDEGRDGYCWSYSAVELCSFQNPDHWLDSSLTTRTKGSEDGETIWPFRWHARRSLVY